MHLDYTRFIKLNVEQHISMCQKYSSIYEIYEYVSYMAQYHLRKHKISLRTVQKKDWYVLIWQIFENWAEKWEETVVLQLKKI